MPQTNLLTEQQLIDTLDSFQITPEMKQQYLELYNTMSTLLQTSLTQQIIAPTNKVHQRLGQQIRGPIIVGAAGSSDNFVSINPANVHNSLQSIGSNP
jgi:hypothetical protein